MTDDHASDRSADRLRRALLGGIALAALAPGVGCSGPSGSVRRRPAAAAPSPRWPDLPPDSYTPVRPRVAGPTASLRSVETAVFHRRGEWASAGLIPRRMDRMLPVRRLTVHHDGMPPVNLASTRDVADRIDLIRKSHQQRGWGDIGYHYIVDPMGGVWEGRPLAWQGAHVANQNPGNLGVLVLGNFQKQTPTPAQLSALDRFIASRLSEHRVSVSEVVTHQELAPTECPGRSLQAYMASTRRPAGRLAMLATGRSLG